MSWYATAKGVILQLKMANPTLGHDELKKLCGQHYPFGGRYGYPYKAWLKAMGEQFGSRAGIKQAKTVGQADLFDPISKP